MNTTTKHPTLADAIRAAIHPMVFGMEWTPEAGATDPRGSEVAVIKMRMEAWEDLRAALPRADAADALAEAAEAYRKTMPGIGATGSALDAALRRYREGGAK